MMFARKRTQPSYPEADIQRSPSAAAEERGDEGTASGTLAAVGCKARLDSSQVNPYLSKG
jgi:hypothetical protein